MAGEYRHIKGKEYKAARSTYNNGSGVNQQTCEDAKPYWQSRGCKCRSVCVSNSKTNNNNKKYILYVEQ